jgi:hypothetical protein
MSLSDAMAKLAQKNRTVVGPPTVTPDGIAGAPTPNVDGGSVLRVKQIAPAGTELVASHPARVAKKD